jgi:glycosyltransferase involved in cell wall biosynthesis
MAYGLRRKLVVVVGGYDTANLPEAGYGSQRGGLRGIVATAVMRLATHLVANSCSARSEAIANCGIREDKISVVYHGVAPPRRSAREPRQRMALTVGNVWRENLLRKGLLPFVQAAHLLPDIRFVHAGQWMDDSIAELRKEGGPNVEFLGFVSDERLAELYEQASVYVQPSLHEGFGMSVAEAMAAGCIPVATRSGSLPEVVGDTGIYLSSATPEAVAEGIMAGLNSSYESRLKAQERVNRMFSLEQREEALKSIVDQLLSSRPAVCSGAGSQVTAPLVK